MTEEKSTNSPVQIAAISFVDVTVRFAVGTILVLSALPKILHPFTFSSVVANYRVLPNNLVRLVAPLLIVIETFSAIMLLLGLLSEVVIPLAGVSFVAFSTAVGINLQRGRRIACGCFGDDKEEISVQTEVRLILLLGAVAFLGATAINDRAHSPSFAWLISHGEIVGMLLPAACTAAFSLMIGAWALTTPEMIAVLRQVRSGVSSQR